MLGLSCCAMVPVTPSAKRHFGVRRLGAALDGRMWLSGCDGGIRPNIPSERSLSVGVPIEHRPEMTVWQPPQAYCPIHRSRGCKATPGPCGTAWAALSADISGRSFPGRVARWDEAG